MKLSITPISFTQSFRSGEMTTADLIDFVVSQNLTGIDLLDPDKYPWAWSSGTNLEECVKQMRDRGLQVAAYACGNNFAKLDSAEKDLQVQAVLRGIERAVQCGTSRVRVFGGALEATGGDAGVTSESGLPMVIEGLERCLPAAADAKVVLALENHGRLPGTSEEMLTVVNHFQSPWLRLTYDPANSQGNSMPEDENPVEACRRILSHIEHMHLKDVREPQVDLSRRREACIAGQGITPLREVVQMVEENGYQGFYTLEYEARLLGPEKEGVIASLDYLKSLATTAR